MGLPIGIFTIRGWIEFEHGNDAYALIIAVKSNGAPRFVRSAPFSRGGTHSVYADAPGGSYVGETLKLTDAAKGANVILRIPKDESLFEDAVQLAPNVFCTNPVVTYLDLRPGPRQFRRQVCDCRRRRSLACHHQHQYRGLLGVALFSQVQSQAFQYTFQTCHTFSQVACPCSRDIRRTAMCRLDARISPAKATPTLIMPINSTLISELPRAMSCLCRGFPGLISYGNAVYCFHVQLYRNKALYPSCAGVSEVEDE